MGWKSAEACVVGGWWRRFCCCGCWWCWWGWCRDCWWCCRPLLAPLIAHDRDIDAAELEPAASGDIQAGWNEYGPAADLAERSPGEPIHDDDGW